MSGRDALRDVFGDQLVQHPVSVELWDVAKLLVEGLPHRLVPLPQANKLVDKSILCGQGQNVALNIMLENVHLGEAPEARKAGGLNRYDFFIQQKRNGLAEA